MSLIAHIHHLLIDHCTHNACAEVAQSQRQRYVNSLQGVLNASTLAEREDTQVWKLGRDKPFYANAQAAQVGPAVQRALQTGLFDDHKWVASNDFLENREPGDRLRNAIKNGDLVGVTRVIWRLERVQAFAQAVPRITQQVNQFHDRWKAGSLPSADLQECAVQIAEDIAIGGGPIGNVEGFGFTTACHLLADLGLPIFKPDIWVCRIVSSLPGVQEQMRGVWPKKLGDAAVPVPFDFLEKRLNAGGRTASKAYRRIVQPRMNALVEEANDFESLENEFEELDLNQAFLRWRFVDWTLVHFAISAERDVYGLERRPIDVLQAEEGQICPQCPQYVRELAFLLVHQDARKRRSLGGISNKQFKVRGGNYIPQGPAIAPACAVLLASAREPLTVPEMAALLVRRNAMATPDTELVEQVLDQMASMIRAHRLSPANNRVAYTIYHHSLRHHIQTCPELKQTVALNRTLLAEAALNPLGDDAADSYLLRNGIAHLLDAGHWQAATNLMTDFAFLMKRFQRLEARGEVADGWYRDWDLLLGHGLPLTGDAAIWWDFARSVRHYFRREGWEAWRVLFQSAIDHADDSPVTQAAEKFVAENLCDWTWVRCITRPHHYKPNALRAVLAGHKGYIVGATQLRGGQLLSWSDDGTLRLWDSKTGAVLAVMKGHSSGIKGACELRDGRILSWSLDSTLRLWDGRAGEQIAVMKGHTDRMLGAQQLCNGSVLSWSSDGTMRLWHSETGTLLSVMSHPGNSALHALGLSNGKILSWTWADKALRLWDSESATMVAVLEGHTGSIEGAQQLGDGRVLSWSNDGTLRLWNSETGAAVMVLKGHGSTVWGAQQMRDGRILSWSGDQTLRLWDSETGTSLTAMIGHTRSVWGALELADSRILSWSSDLTSRIWDSQTGTEITLMDQHIFRIDGARQLLDGQLLSWSESDSVVNLWDSKTGAKLMELTGSSGPCELGDGRLLARSRNNTLRIWEKFKQAGAGQEPPEQLKGLNRHKHFLRGAKQLQDGRIVSWSGDASLCLWDGKKGDALALLTGHTGWIAGVHQLRDGRILSWSGIWSDFGTSTLRLWDSNTGAELTVMEGHTERIYGACELRDGRILSWSLDSTLRLWDDKTGKELAVMKGHTGRILGALQKHDGTVLSWSSDGTMRIWNSETGKALSVIRHRGDSTLNVLELSDGRILSWLSNGRTLRLWDSKAGFTLAVLRGHTQAVVGAQELSDQRILSWSDDDTLRIWDSQSGAELAVMAGRSEARQLRDGRHLEARQLRDGRLLSWLLRNTLSLHLWDSDNACLLCSAETPKQYESGCIAQAPIPFQLTVRLYLLLENELHAHTPIGGGWLFTDGSLHLFQMMHGAALRAVGGVAMSGGEMGKADAQVAAR